MNVQSSPAALADVLARGDIWRGNALATLPVATLPTGHAELDAELPGGGWPCGNLTEILVDRCGIGEMGLLFPALAKLSASGGCLALVAPPWLVHAPAWQAAGVALERLVLIHAGRDAAWCIEQLLASGGFAGVLAWPGAELDARRLRRMQLAAEGRAVFACLWRSTAVARVPSPAPLRVALEPEQVSVSADGGAGLAVRILKRRGRAASRQLALSVPRPLSEIGRSSRVVARSSLSLLAARSPAAAPIA